MRLKFIAKEDNVMLENLAERAKQGDAGALDDLVRQLNEPIYKLALRMLYHPSDAEDAAQEIMIKIVTHVGAFQGKCSFKTYAFRIATNHLRTLRRRKPEFEFGPLDEMAGRIVEERAARWNENTSEAHQNLFVREILYHCLQALLMALDRERRLAYILGEIFDLTGEQAAHILDITPEAFRKRLSRARKGLREFMLQYCALIRPDNPCRCEQQAAHFSQTGELCVKKLIFAHKDASNPDYRTFFRRLGELDELKRVRTLFKTCPDLAAPDTIVRRIRKMASSGQFELLRLD